MTGQNKVKISGYTKNDPSVRGRDPLVHLMFETKWDMESFSFRPSDGPRIRAAIKKAEAHAKTARVTRKGPHFQKTIILKPTGM